MVIQKRIFFYSGPNGSGKTKYISEHAINTRNSRKYSIAISNTPFSRFPHSSKFFKALQISPKSIRKTIFDSFKQYFSSEHRDTFKIPFLLERIGFDARVELEISKGFNDNIYDVRGLNPNDYDSLQDVVNIIFSEHTSRFRLNDSYNSFEMSLRGRLRVIYKYIEELMLAKVISSYRLIFFHNTRGEQVFNELSSGEQTLISTFLFLKNNCDYVDCIYIDEPENSLHPHWQESYVEMLHMALGYNEANIHIATHSPLIMSGALTSHGDYININQLYNNNVRNIDIDACLNVKSIEKILWEVFSTVTPASHYLSVELSDILQMLVNNEVSYEEAKSRIMRYYDKSYDERQKEVLQETLENLSYFVN